MWRMDHKPKGKLMNTRGKKHTANLCASKRKRTLTFLLLFQKCMFHGLPGLSLEVPAALYPAPLPQYDKRSPVKQEQPEPTASKTTGVNWNRTDSPVYSCACLLRLYVPDTVLVANGLFAFWARDTFFFFFFKDIGYKSLHWIKLLCELRWQEQMALQRLVFLT